MGAPYCITPREVTLKTRRQLIFELAPKISKPGITPGRAVIEAQRMHTDAERIFGSNAEVVLEMFESGQEPRWFLDGFQNAYLAGKMGNRAALKNSSVAAYLTEEQREIAYQLGEQSAMRKAGGNNQEESGNNQRRVLRLDASGVFVNNKERLYRFAQLVKPIDGYTDFVCHADPDGFYIDTIGNGNEADMAYYSPEEFAQMIRNSKKYTGGKVRILSCQAGAKENGAAYRLAQALNEEVLAPTEILNVDEDGNIFLSDNDILAEIWYDSKNKALIKETGKWRNFYPKGEEKE